MVRGTARAWLTSTAQAATPLAIIAPVADERVATTPYTFAWGWNAIQDQFRLQIYSDAAGETIVVDTQWVSQLAQSYSQALTALPGGRVYYVRVFAHGEDGEEGESTLVPFYFALGFTALTGLTARAYPGCEPSADELPGVLLQWDAAVPGASDVFLAYEVQRREAGTSDVWNRLVRITSVSTTRYFDANIIPGVEYEYAVLWYVDSGGDILLSLPQSPTVSARVVFDWIYLHDTSAPESRFFRVEAFNGTVKSNLDIAYAQPFGQVRPAAFVGEAMWHTISLAGLDQLRRKPRVWAKMLDLFQRQSTNPTTLCVRFGLDRELYYVAWHGLSKRLDQRSYSQDIVMTEVEFCEDIGFGYTTYTPVTT